MRPVVWMARRCEVSVGADPCVRPIALVMLLKVGTGRDLSLQAQDLDIARYSGESRNPERMGLDEGASLSIPMDDENVPKVSRECVSSGAIV